MPEDVVDIGVDDFDCRPNHTSGSASDEVEAEISAGEAHVLTLPSESRNLASEMFHGKELLLACRTLRKDPCQHVWIISVWFSLCQDQHWVGCSECVSSAMVVEQRTRPLG